MSQNMDYSGLHLIFCTCQADFCQSTNIVLHFSFFYNRLVSICKYHLNVFIFWWNSYSKFVCFVLFYLFIFLFTAWFRICYSCCWRFVFTVRYVIKGQFIGMHPTYGYDRYKNSTHRKWNAFIFHQWFVFVSFRMQSTAE